jgi:3-hydroxyacyl-CoA dehydrogenase
LRSAAACTLSRTSVPRRRFEVLGKDASEMTRRQSKAATRATERRRADRDLLDEALAPYLRAYAADDTDVLDLAAADLVAEPVYVTVHIGGGATIDLRRQPGRSSVVRLRRRPVAIAG